MRFFTKEKIIIETKCKECGMEFSEPERMLRHMIKAHTKKKPSCNCWGRNYKNKKTGKKEINKFWV